MRFSEKEASDDQVVVSATVKVRRYSLQHLFRQFSALHFKNKKGISFPPVSNKGDENVL